MVESLIKSGAMDALGRRAQLMAVADNAMEHAQKAQKDALLGQHGLFGVFQQDEENQTADKPLPEHAGLGRAHAAGLRERDSRLLHHRTSAGEIPGEAGRLPRADHDAVCELKASTGRGEVTVGGVLKGIRVAKSKRGDLYAQGQIEDMNGSVDILCFADAYKRLAEKIKLTVPVLVKGGVRVEEGSNPKLMIDDITPLEEAKPKLASHLRIKVSLETASANDDRRASHHLSGA